MILWYDKTWINGGCHKNIMPVINGDYVYIRTKKLVVMQNYVLEYKAQTTEKDFEKRLIPVLEWPPNFSDLNPVEIVWDWINN